MMHLQRSTRHTYTHLILSNICAVFPHDSGPIIKQDKRTWKIASHDVTCTHHIGADTFKEATGRMPEPWELDRINCPHSGQLGHYACGWCSFHRQPILICGCRNREP